MAIAVVTEVQSEDLASALVALWDCLRNCFEAAVGGSGPDVREPACRSS